MIDVAPINELSISLSLLSLRSRSLLLRLEGDERSQSLNNPLPCRLVIGQYLSSSGEVISHLNISSLHSSDGGLYKCRAENSVGRAEHQARVNVYGQSILQLAAGPGNIEENFYQFTFCKRL